MRMKLYEIEPFFGCNEKTYSKGNRKKICRIEFEANKGQEKNEELPPKTQELKSSLLDIYKFACE